jgi:hypothetical protein
VGMGSGRTMGWDCGGRLYSQESYKTVASGTVHRMVKKKGRSIGTIQRQCQIRVVIRGGMERVKTRGPDEWEDMIDQGVQLRRIKRP